MTHIFKKTIVFITTLAILSMLLPTSMVLAATVENLCESATLISSNPASGSSSTVPARMFDGDDTTYFQSYTSKTDGTFILDFGEEKTFNRLLIKKPTSAKRYHSISLQVSDDNQSWSEVFAGAMVPNWGSVEILFDFPQTSGRYVKFYIHDIVLVNNYAGFAISELKLFNINGTSENLLENAPVIQSTVVEGAYVNSVPTHSIQMFDADETSVFVSETTESETFIADLGEVSNFNTLKVIKGSNYTGAFDLEIEGSTDNSVWEAIYTANGIEGLEAEYFIGDYEARYVRFNFTNLEDGRIGIAALQLSEVLDTEAPVITLLGESNIELDLGDEFVDPGYTAIDNRDGDITERVIVSGDTVDTNTRGIYRIVYTVSDEAGNTDEKERIVGVGVDSVPPVITLLGAEVIEIGVGSTFVDPGCTAYDEVDGYITENIVVSGDIVDTSVAGTYVIKYDVADNFGNNALTVTRTVNVIVDTIPPVISLEGETEIDLQIGDTYEEPGYSAEDNLDGDITENVVVSGNAIDTSARGEFVVTYTVSDAAGNETSVTRTVYVGMDRTPPVITLKGYAQTEIALGGTYIDAGYIAEDDQDGIITDQVVVSGDVVDVNTLGTYVINYDVEDSSGNPALTVSRTVKVIENPFGTNICVGADLLTGSSSGNGGTVTTNIFDGNPETNYRSWQAENRTGEFILDFGEEKRFNQLVVIQSASVSRYFTLTLQTGESATGPWSNVIEPMNIAAGDGTSTTENFSITSARYVRFYVDQVDPASKIYNIAELQLYMNEESYVIDSDTMSVEIPSKTGVNIALPTEGAYGSNITWKSSNTKVMSNDGRIVKRPSIADGEKTVTLTAKFSYGETVIEKDFEITIIPKNPAEESSFDGPAGVEALGDADYQTVFSITHGSSIEITLDREEHLGTAKLELESENRISKATIYAWNGTEYVPVGNWMPMLRSTSESVLLKFERGTYEKIKIDFETNGATIVSELILGMTDRDAVDYLAESLTVSEENSNHITKDLVLKKKGEYGQTVTWSSSDTTVILDNGTVIRKSTDKNVTMTAVVTKGEETETVVFDLTVLKKEESGDSQQGGSSIKIPAGGGGGASSEPIKKKIFGVDESHWAYSYVGELAQRGIISGNENGDFEPEKEITRSEFVKILVFAFNLTDKGNAEAFADVEDSSWYAPYINIARSNGIITGNELNCAMPNEKISRQDMAVMIGRALQASGKTIPHNREYVEFTDNVNISGYASEFIRTLYCGGIIDGMGEGNFAPLNSATKAQAAKLIASML